MISAEYTIHENGSLKTANCILLRSSAVCWKNSNTILDTDNFPNECLCLLVPYLAPSSLISYRQRTQRSKDAGSTEKQNDFPFESRNTANELAVSSTMESALATGDLQESACLLTASDGELRTSCSDEQDFIVESGPADNSCIEDVVGMESAPATGDLQESAYLVTASDNAIPASCSDEEDFVVEPGPVDNGWIEDVGMESEPATGDLQESAHLLTASDNAITASCSDEEDLIVETRPVDKGCIQDIIVDGRRVVDLNHFWKELHDNFDNHNPERGCHFKNLRLIKSYDEAMRTQLTFKCEKCGVDFRTWTDPESEMDVNKSAVCGTLTSGTGYSTMEEQFAAMGIPTMCADTYRKTRDTLYQNFHDLVEEETQRAAAIEREIAIKKGHTINGVPYIDVIADGCWAKRSYASSKHNSLSGAAVIFGRETGLALHVGVRNKYCATHERAERCNREPPPHKCFKNWGRDQSSTSMETNIILEGFKTSIETNGLIYRVLISDGDSSVYQAIRDANPYQEYGITVEKIECNNHLFRNLCRKVEAASKLKICNVPSKGPRNITMLRKRVSSSSLKMRRVIEEARDFRNAEDVPDTEKAVRLCKDILAIPAHVFGDHSGCQELPFKCVPIEKEESIVETLQAVGIYPAIKEAVRYLSCFSKSLLKGATTNVAESCKSIINKLNSGKRINHCLKNSYEIRVLGAVVQHNTQALLSSVYRQRNCEVPAGLLKMESRRRIKNERSRVSKQKMGRKTIKYGGTDKDYGPSAEKPDIDKEIFEVLAENHMEKLFSNQRKWQDIERDTVDQSRSDLWHRLHKELITASKFGTICRMQPTTSCTNVVLSIRYPKYVDAAATNYGRENEAKARKMIEEQLNITIKLCGLFIDRDIPYLGASPDGLIDEDGVVEIKCPYTARNGNLEKCIEEMPALRRIYNSKRDGLNKSHHYYYQVQGQLHITRRTYCIFALWNSDDIKVITVHRDDDFWQSRMEPHLCRFYVNCVLPEIVDSRRNRSMAIRDPEYIVQAQQAMPVNKRKPRKPPAALIPLIDENAASEKEEENVETWVTIDSDDDVEILTENRDLLHKLRQDIDVEEIIVYVSHPTSFLTDSCIDLFQNILQEHTTFQCNPASYSAYFKYIEPCCSGRNDLQIIGGNKSRHWCCLHYDGKTIWIYDSLLRCEYVLLSAEEKRYIAKRYPHVSVEHIVLQPVTKQPDRFSCGVYAIAFATTVALGNDPCRTKYSRDILQMRGHLVRIFRERRLIEFPCRSRQ